jgi:hypothetical protein
VEAYVQAGLTKHNFGLKSATSSELLSDLKDGKQMPFKSKGIFSGQSQEMEFILSGHKNWNSLYPV